MTMGNTILILCFIVGTIGLIQPKLIRCKSRGVPFVLLVGVLTTAVSLWAMEQGAAQAARQAARFATLKAENPEQYLEELRDMNEGRWLKALAEMRPKQYKVTIS
jgi:hypothetical protein